MSRIPTNWHAANEDEILVLWLTYSSGNPTKAFAPRLGTQDVYYNRMKLFGNQNGLSNLESKLLTFWGGLSGGRGSLGFFFADADTSSVCWDLELGNGTTMVAGVDAGTFNNEDDEDSWGYSKFEPSSSDESYSSVSAQPEAAAPDSSSSRSELCLAVSSITSGSFEGS